MHQLQATVALNCQRGELLSELAGKRVADNGKAGHQTAREIVVSFSLETFSTPVPTLVRTTPTLSSSSLGFATDSRFV